MKKISVILAMIAVIVTVSIMTGCGGSSSSGGSKDLYKADSWDYDGDGKLNNKELNDYADFYQDAYDYAYGD